MSTRLDDPDDCPRCGRFISGYRRATVCRWGRDGKVYPVRIRTHYQPCGHPVEQADGLPADLLPPRRSQRP